MVIHRILRPFIFASLVILSVVTPGQTVGAAPTYVPDKASIYTPGVTGSTCINSNGDGDEIPVGCRQVSALLYKDGWVYAAGAISQVVDNSNPAAPITISGYKNLFRYNPVNGKVDQTFKMQFYTDTNVVESGMIRSISNGPGTSIYVAGDFKYIENTPGGSPKNQKGVAKINTSTLKFDTTFKPNLGCAGASTTPCEIYTVAYAPLSGTVLVGGKIVAINGATNYGFGIVDATTGVTPAGVAVTLSNPLLANKTYVRAIAINPVNGYDIFISGDFNAISVNGGATNTRYSMAKLRLTAARALTFRLWNAIPALSASRPTGVNTQTGQGELAGKCSTTRHWIRQMQYAPDGKSISTASSATGYGDAYPALCDSFATFGTESVSDANTTTAYDQNRKPIFYNRTPVDTVQSICYLDNNSAYVGGHFKGFNNVVYVNGVRTYYTPWYVNGTTPNITEAQPNAHFGMALIDTSASGTTRGKAVTNWNNTILETDPNPEKPYYPWKATAGTATGRGNGFTAAICIPAASSPTGKPMVIFGGDDGAPINGDYKRQKIAQFN